MTNTKFFTNRDGNTLMNNLSSINNKSITTSIKRYSTLSRKEMEVLSANYDLCYLLGVLNTRIAQRLFNEIRGGDYHVVPEHIRQIPIPRVTKQDQGEVVDIVRKVLAQKKRLLSADTSQLEDKIESLVLKHYNMSIINCS